MEVLTETSRYVSVPLAAAAVSVLVLKGSFRRVEHVLLARNAIFVAYIVSGLLAQPDWGAAATGLLVPSMPLTRSGVLVIVATIGTTLAPWGLAFIQSYAVDERLSVKDLGYERVDVIAGAVLTGIIGAFIVIGCAATLHKQGQHIDDASDAPSRSDRSQAARPRRYSAWDSSAPRSWQQRSSRCRPPTRSPRRSTSAATSTTAFVRLPCSTAPTRVWRRSATLCCAARSRGASSGVAQPAPTARHAFSGQTPR